MDAVVELVKASESQCLLVDEFHIAFGEDVRKQVGKIQIAKLYGAMASTRVSLSSEPSVPMVFTGVRPKLTANDPALYLHSSGSTGECVLINSINH